VSVMRAIISPRTLHQLCRVARETASSKDLQAAPCAALLLTLLSAGASLQRVLLMRLEPHCWQLL
jgi:hypothetical protein